MTALAEQLDRALAAAHLEPASSDSAKIATSPEIKVDPAEDDDIHTDAAILSSSSANTSGDAGGSVISLWLI